MANQLVLIIYALSRLLMVVIVLVYSLITLIVITPLALELGKLAKSTREG